MFISVGRKHIALGPRARLAAATSLALCLHLFVFWGLLAMRPQPMVLPEQDFIPPVDVQFYEVVEPPEPVLRVVPLEAERPREVEVQPKKVEPIKVQADSTPAAQPAPEPVHEPVLAPKLATKARQSEEVVVEQLQTGQVKSAQVREVDTVVAQVSPAQLARAKKKAEEEELQREAGAKALAELELHQAAKAPAALSAAVEPSGLPAPGAAKALGSPSFLPSAGQMAGAAKGGANGAALKGGRGKLTQAMQNHNYCNDTVQKGKTVPADCQMADLKGQGNLGLKPSASLQKAAAERDAELRYKTTPGSQDLWNTAMRQPSAPPNKDDQPKYGDYSNAKRQRVNGQCFETSSCTDDGRETRRPGDPKPGG